MVQIQKDVSATTGTIYTVPIGRYLEIYEIIFTDTSAATNNLQLDDFFPYAIEDNAVNTNGGSGFTENKANISVSANGTQSISLDKPIKIFSELRATASGTGKLTIIGKLI